MSKKHFVQLADCLKHSKPSTNMPRDQYGAMLDQWQRDCGAIAMACKSANPAFMMNRWFSYLDGQCGPNGGKV